MFGWLRSLLGVRSGRDRVVYRYFDGARHRSADPLRLKAALDTHCPNWADAVAKLAEQERVGAALGAALGTLGAVMAREHEALVIELVRGARKAFGLVDYDDDGPAGVTDLEAFAVLTDYLVWVADLLEDTRPLRTGPAPSGSAPAPSVPAKGSDSPSTPSASSASARPSSHERSDERSPGPTEAFAAASVSTVDRLSEPDAGGEG